MRALLCAALLLSLALAGCTSPPPGGNQTAPPTSPPGQPPATVRPATGFNPIARLSTDQGDVYIEVFEEMVPLTAANFLGYVRSGFFEGIKVHRVVGPQASPPAGFMVQMGDPNTRDPTKGRETWGRGDPNLPKVPDELHPALKHDAAGIVSMANAGPNTGSSQFFITLTATPSLDGKHAVFGKVVAGMDVVRAIGNVAVQGEAPAEDIVIRDTEVIDKQRDPAKVTRGIEAWSYVTVLNTTANSTITVPFVVQNKGNVRESVAARLEPPQGWDSRLIWPLDTNVSAGMGQVFVFALTSPLDATLGTATLPATAVFSINGSEARAGVQVRPTVLGKRAVENTPVGVHYTGTLTDGRLFDTNRWHIASNTSVPKLPLFQLRPQNQYEATLDFTVFGGQVITGFSEGVWRLREGETRTVVVPPEKAYGNTCGQQGCRLEGRTLVFIVELVRVGAAG